MIVIFNPVAGRRRRHRLERVLARLRAAGAAVDVRPTARRGDAADIAASLAPPADGLIVAAGGDGTVAEVAAGLARNPARGGLRLGVIPLGTANVLACEIGLSARPAAVAAALLGGRTRQLRLGRIRDGAGADCGRFLLMAGAGFDAEVVEAVSPGLKRLLGKGAYVFETLRRAARTPPELTVEIDGARHAARTVVVSNARHYGGPYVIAPDADLSAPEFRVTLMPDSGVAAVARSALALARGRISRLPGVAVVTATRVRIAAAGAAPLQADGDVVAALPVDIDVAAETLLLVIP